MINLIKIINKINFKGGHNFSLDKKIKLFIYS